MKFTLKNILWAFFSICLSSSVSAMSLGDGQIISRVGEPFSANISLVGAYDRDIRFYQVKGSECHSSLIGSTAAGCDSVFEGRLTFFIKKKPDGQYFLRVDGERSEDFFYRVIIKYKSPASGLVYKAFDFLPEFKNNHDAPPATANDGDITVNTNLPSGKYGVLMGNVVEVPSDIADKPALHEPAADSPDKNASVPAEVDTATTVDGTKKKSGNSNALTKRVAKTKRQTSKAAMPELLIKKEGSYADEIFVLQKENEAIEQQIILLEKQIALLKEVNRLKAQAGESPAPAPAIALEMTPAIHMPESSPAAVSNPAPAPVKIPAQIAIQQDNSGISLLNWILIVAILLLLAMLWFLYRKQKNLRHKDSLAEFKSVMVSPGTESFDFTGKFHKK